jgi:RNA polymerase sigma-70 factor (ECF subfamily)
MAYTQDEQLVKEAVKGDQEAFSEIVKRWERKIFALCYGILGCEELARDAMQETFILAYKNLSNFRGEAKVSSWLHRIAINQCLTKQRILKRRNENSLEEEIEKNPSAMENQNDSDGTSPVKALEREERIRLVRKAINALPFELKQVVIMKEFEDMTFQEISETLGIPTSTVKSRLYTALKQLRKKLEEKSLEVI